MARPSIRRLAGHFAPRIRGSARASVVVVVVVVVALVGVLVGAALLNGGPGAAASGGVARVTGATPGALEQAPPVTTGPTLSRDVVIDDAVRTAGALLPVQVPHAARALARLGSDARLVAIVLAGLVLALLGRRPRTRRPTLLLVPSTAAPGLRVRRRGPPPR